MEKGSFQEWSVGENKTGKAIGFKGMYAIRIGGGKLGQTAVLILENTGIRRFDGHNADILKGSRAGKMKTVVGDIARFQLTADRVRTGIVEIQPEKALLPSLSNVSGRGTSSALQP